MEKGNKKMLVWFLAAAVLGVLLHFLYEWFPIPALALISPVRESIWEHVKLICFPLLLVSLVMGRGGQGARAPWLLSMIVACVVMLGVGYVYHVIFRGEAMAVDLILYVLMIALGFLLPRTLWPLCGPPAVEKAKAVRPRAIIIRVWGLRKIVPSALAPTETPSRMVTMLISAFWAVSLNRGTTPLSRNRLPSISIPSSGATEGSISTTTIVTAMGKMIFSV